MHDITISSFRKNVSSLIESVINNHEPIRISTKNGNIVLLDEILQ